ncbi:MAG: hypothetical protein R8L58_03925 [Mariprofundaceae bacterium]
MKKVMIGLFAVLVVIAGGLIYVWSSLDGIVKNAIQTYGSEATKTEVSVASVRIKPESGEGSIAGLSVANPQGFSDANIFQLGEISTKIDTASITRNPVIIDELIIKAPAVFYEINKAGTSNVDALKKNLGLSSDEQSAAGKEEGGEAKKMIIKKLVVEGGKARVLIAALGGKEQSVALPAMRLTDVGKKTGGATALEVARILSNAMLKNVKGSVARVGVNQYLGKSADAFKKGALGKIGGAAGEAPADMGGALKGLLGR